MSIQSMLSIAESVFKYYLSNPPFNVLFVNYILYFQVFKYL